MLIKNNSVLLAGIITLTASGCSSGLFGFSNNALPISLNANFESPTGWDNTSGDPLEITIDRTSIAPTAALECRTGVKATLSSKPFSACGTSILPTADVSQDSGTYRTEVQAVSNGSVIASASLDFYVHPSLTGLSTCTPSKTDEQYLQEAGTYLNQSTSFGGATSLNAPFTHIVLGNGQNLYPMTLRKKFVMNEAKTLILLKRRFSSQQANCFFKVPVMNRRYRSFANLTAATIATPALEELNIQKSRSDLDNSVMSGLVPMLPFAQDPGTIQVDPSMDTGKSWAWYTARTRKAPANGYTKIHTEYYASQTNCEALVINARGHSICFEDGSARLFQAPRIKPSLSWNPYKNSVPYGGGYKTKSIFSSKWRKSEEADFLNFKTQHADHGNFVRHPITGNDYEFYLLED